MNHARRSSLAIVLIALLAACSTPASSSPAASAPAAVEADMTITVVDLEFDTTALSTPADVAFTLALVNEEDMPHNVSIYADESAAEEIFAGEYVTGDTIVYDIAALPAGEYFFRCDLHPEMNGTFTIEDAPGASG